MYGKLNGLVLAGGRSERMGRDKGLMRWHGRAQRYYLADLLARYCGRVFISCRPEQRHAIVRAGYEPLVDSSPAKGQYGAILSALAARPDDTWLVAACDLPLVDGAALARLIEQRDTAKLATAYASPDNGLPEPLLAIWEPSSRGMLLDRHARGLTCPRKALISSQADVKLVPPGNPSALMNANTPGDARRARRLLAQRPEAVQRAR